MRKSEEHSFPTESQVRSAVKRGSVPARPARTAALPASQPGTEATHSPPAPSPSLRVYYSGRERSATRDAAHLAPPSPLTRPAAVLQSLPSTTPAADKDGQLIREILDEVVDMLAGKDVYTVSKADREVVETLIDERILRHNARAEQTGSPGITAVAELKQHLIADVFGLGKLQPLCDDEAVTDIFLSGPSRVLYKKNGLLRVAQGISWAGQEELLSFLQRRAALAGRRLDEARGRANVRLPGGARMHVILPPLATTIAVSIRLHRQRTFSLDDLVERDFITAEAAEFLTLCVRANSNIVISGPTGAGKTTLVNALVRAVPGTERIITIEDTREIQSHGATGERLQAREENTEGAGRIPIRELVIEALRMCPDRIVVGECRGAEALDMLRAMNTGHSGSMTTVHSASPRDALNQLRLYASEAPERLPQELLTELIARTIGIVVQVQRFPGDRRRVTAINEVAGLESGVIGTNEIFVSQPAEESVGHELPPLSPGWRWSELFVEEEDAPTKPLPVLRWTGRFPKFAQALRAAMRP